MKDVAASIADHVAAGEAQCHIPEPVVRILAESGCFGRVLPAEFGGAEAAVAAFAIQQEELAAVWPTAAVAATWANLSGRLIARFGNVEQRRQLLPGLVRGNGLGAVAWTEPHGGSDAARLRTKARRVPGGWILDGAKRLIDNAAAAEFIIVGCRVVDADDPDPRRRLAMLVVRRDDPGFVFEGPYETLGLRAAGVGRFRLENCFVPDDRLLGTAGRGFHQMMDMVEFGRTGVAAICLGIAEAALRACVEFLPTRNAFGQNLAANDALVARVADLRTSIDAARLLTERAASMVDNGIACARESAMAKLFASELATEVTAAAVHLHGGIGYTSETPVAMLLRDSHAFTIGEGTSEVMRRIIGSAEFARAQLSKEQFSRAQVATAADRLAVD